MKRRTLLTASTAASAALAATAAPARAHGGRGRTAETLRTHSRILGREVLHALYLPPGWRPRGRYRVLFLLHGGGVDDRTSWLREGRLRQLLDRAIARRRIPPLVVAIPDAWRDPYAPKEGRQLTYYMNDADGSYRYADMVTEEFVPYVEERYGAGGSPGRRGIGGLSMGGFGALSFALRHQGMFAGAFGLSAAHRTDAQLVALDAESYRVRFARAWGEGLVGEERLNALCRYWSLLDTIERTPAEQLARTPYYLDCGAYDEFFEGNAQLHLALTRKKAAHRFLSREGTHDWEYWTSGLPGALDFLAEHLD
ncbi:MULTISPECIES: alpha/beta hydrolase [Streptomyces]|uniref:alpha/beta hydrolase n=1 Tax=Streptomyces TaxID=1883 RepID=UPI00058BA730|nr:alpha/beta hydrolase-fold protein [Streptomyces sp. SCSIO ZS0520]